MDLIEIFNNVLNFKSQIEISNILNVSNSTINRWIKLNKIPPAYQFDLMKLNQNHIDYSKFSYKEKDQFFTDLNTSKYCFNVFKKKMSSLNENINIYHFIEPSAGNGSFLSVLPKDKTISFDIEPRHKDIIQQDYLNWYPNDNKKYIIFGNPPFGLRGHMALQFINHSNKFADFVCFILPQLFESDGKGTPRKRVKGFNLIHSEIIDSKFYYPNNKNIKINCLFQIWSKNHINNDYIINNIINDNIKVYSVSDGGTSSTIRNKKMLYKCDIYLPSTCYGKENMKYYLTFDSLYNKKGYGIVFLKNKKENLIKFKNIKWNEIAFLSTNSALNIRTSQITELFK